LGIEDVDVVGPGDAGETAGKIALLVPGEDEDGDHVGLMVSRWSERIVEREISEVDVSSIGVAARAGYV
jgi:hypothetical protein